MSQYAKIIKRLQVHVPRWKSTFGECTVLPVGAEVKNIKLLDNGVYTCQARYGVMKDWEEVHTSLDMPAFTDKGNTERMQALSGKKAKSGRPPVGEKKMGGFIGLRLSDNQMNYLDNTAAAHNVRLSEYVRRILCSGGMPAA